ncbi:MAG: winged helix-turn-helix transcriptional regulator [Candidatus Aenigmarchaeota archaeon]|nr:winged helix-turn-helix transcriptional regulator [Candidatus Aenigmarchaeota archaeon]
MQKEMAYKLFFKALCNNTRLRIIRLLQKESLNVTEISKQLRLEQSSVSHALKCLTDCGFVEVKQIGKKRVYSLNKDTIAPMLKLIDRHSKKYYRHLVKCGVIK